ncbi:MAG: hypothetical protein WBO92_05030 [Candidatus Moraniibacteriota bacterium]
MNKLFSTLAATLMVVAFGANAQTVTDEAICRAAGIGAGNISNYKAAYFDENPNETMLVILSATVRLSKQPRYLQEKVNVAKINAASPKSWPSVQAALNEFNKLCPCGGQSPCNFGDTPTKIEKVN